MATREQLIATVKSIDKDARALLEIATKKASLKGKKASLTQSEINQINSLIKRSENAVSEASERAKARRNDEIKELEGRIQDIESSLAVPLNQETIDYLKNKKRNLRAQLLNRQTKVALEFGGILTGAQISEIQGLLAEAKTAVAKKKKAAGFIKSLFQMAELAGSIVRKASGIL